MGRTVQSSQYIFAGSLDLNNGRSMRSILKLKSDDKELVWWVLQVLRQ